MDFSKTYIAIRQRNILEIFDLSLLVIREYLPQLFWLWLVSALPWFIFNWLIIGWLGNDYYDASSLALYFYLMSLMVLIQSQLATIPITIFLGKSMFEEKPSVWECFVAALKSSLAIFWVHGILRMLVPALLLAMTITESAVDDSIASSTVILSLVVGLGFLIRGSRPFATEIVSLEKTPFRKKGEQISYGKRSSSLHGAASGELFSRACITCLLAISLTLSVMCFMLCIDFVFDLSAGYGSLPTVIYFPIACWIVAGIVAVARFLSYIDIRIRQEGWEVELRMRSEAIRLQEATGARP